MNRPSMLARAITADDVRVIEKWVSRIIHVALLVGGLAIASGWRWENPNSRVSALEARVERLEEKYADFSLKQELQIRLGCLGISRREANYAGACVGLPTREESTRVSR